MTVVIPMYNAEQYIERAILSVLAQTVADFELIIVNDGSTDGSTDKIKNFHDERIRVIDQENCGECAARNKGIVEANSEMVSFLDADDAYNPRFLETILKLHEMFPEAGACATAYEVINEKGKTIQYKHKGIPVGAWEGIIENYFLAALSAPPFFSSSIAIHKNVFYNVGFFPVGVCKGGDLDMWGRLAVKYQIAYSTYPGSRYYKNAKNRVSNIPVHIGKRKVTETLDILIKNSKINGDIVPFVERYIEKKELETASECLKNGRFEDVREIVRRCKRVTFKGTLAYMLSFLPYRVVLFVFSILNKIRK